MVSSPYSGWYMRERNAPSLILGVHGCGDRRLRGRNSSNQGRACGLLAESRTRSCALRSRSGFTLIEVLAVVVILGILAGVVINRAWNAVIQARVETAKAQIAQIEEAIQMFHMDIARYPAALGDLITKPSDAAGYREGGYLKVLPKDPWKNDYFYKIPGPEGKPYVVGSYGSDKKEGGESDGKDITCWTIHETAE